TKTAGLVYQPLQRGDGDVLDAVEVVRQIVPEALLGEALADAVVAGGLLRRHGDHDQRALRDVDGELGQPDEMRPRADSGRALRWTTAGVALALVARARGLSFRMTRPDLTLLAGATTLGVFLNQITFANALHLAPASTVALVFGTMPIFVALISQVSGTERLR